MKYTEKQINNLENLLRKHIHGSKEQRISIEISMKKYGCNGPGDVYKLLKRIRNEEKEAESDLA